jgi:hypothetical protein
VVIVLWRLPILLEFVNQFSAGRLPLAAAPPLGQTVLSPIENHGGRYQQ